MLMNANQKLWDLVWAHLKHFWKQSCRKQPKFKPDSPLGLAGCTRLKVNCQVMRGTDLIDALHGSASMALQP